MAEGVLRSMLSARGLGSHEVAIDSAGTHDYQAGKPPAPLALEVAKLRGYDISRQVARRIMPSDFDRFDFILSMDRGQLANLRTVCPTRCKQKVELLLEYGETYYGQDVPDPYGGNVRDFEKALAMIEDGCRGFATLLAQMSKSKLAPTAG